MLNLYYGKTGIFPKYLCGPGSGGPSIPLLFNYFENYPISIK